MIRAFVCIELSDILRGEIASQLDSLRRIGAGVKWVQPGNLHITLKFLGDIPQDTVGSVVQAVQLSVSNLKPFFVGFSGIGAFPSMKKPSVFWIGVTKGLEELSVLASSIDAQLSIEGFAREKRNFTPHLTIGRVKSPEDTDELNTALSRMQQVYFGEMKVDTITVMESKLYRSGPVYNRLEKVSLRTL